jgi:hypothetical protein
MTIDGPDDRPLALDVLAKTESPEIVRAALGRFRRKLLVRGLILALIVATGVFLYPRYVRPDPGLDSEIRHGRSVTLFHTVKAGAVEATIFAGARLSNEVLAPDQRIGRYGLRINITSESVRPDEQLLLAVAPDLERGVLQIQTAIGSENIPAGLDVSMSLISGTRVIDLPVAGIVYGASGVTLTHRLLGTIHIEMNRIGAPDWLWR